MSNPTVQKMHGKQAEFLYGPEAMFVYSFLPVGGAIKGIGSAIKAISATSKIARPIMQGAYSVYHGLDAAGKVRYVGITSRAPAVRFAEHLSSGTARSNLQYRVINGATGLTKMDARILEQNLINALGLQKNGGALLNKINSIAPKYWGQYGIIP
jgi:hypothetical protein